MINPEKRVLEELDAFLMDELESSTTGRRLVCEEIVEKLAEIKLDVSKEYNILVA